MGDATMSGESRHPIASVLVAVSGTAWAMLNFYGRWRVGDCDAAAGWVFIVFAAMVIGHRALASPKARRRMLLIVFVTCVLVDVFLCVASSRMDRFATCATTVAFVVIGGALTTWRVREEAAEERGSHISP